jgi:hypothetical protein
LRCTHLDAVRSRTRLTDHYGDVEPVGVRVAAEGDVVGMLVRCGVPVGCGVSVADTEFVGVVGELGRGVVVGGCVVAAGVVSCCAFVGAVAVDGGLTSS